MTSKQFQRMKEASSEMLEALRSIMKPDLGSHKKTRLVQAGCHKSGSILHDTVSGEHGSILAEDFRNIFGQSEDQSNLRFVTILHSVVPVDTDRAMHSVAEMENEIERLLEPTGARFLGAVEVEVVSLELMRRIRASRGDQARKLTVLERLIDTPDGILDTGLLVHIHGVLDLSNSILQDNEIRELLQASPFWSRSGHQIEVKVLFSKNDITTNLANIASYITKGGNETLRYNPGFGRDPADQLEAAIWRAGLGRKDDGAETVTDERALSFSEIAMLDGIWRIFMARSTDDRGYLVSIGVCSVVSSYKTMTRPESYKQQSNESNKDRDGSMLSGNRDIDEPYRSLDLLAG